MPPTGLSAPTIVGRSEDLLSSDRFSKSCVGIVVLNFNGTDDTLECLESLEPLNAKNVLIWVVDNGSKEDPTERIAARFKWCVVARSPTNEGWAGGNNIGIRLAMQAKCDWVMLLNNDTKVSLSIVSRLLDAAALDNQVGIIGPMINEWAAPDSVQTAASLFNRQGSDYIFQSAGTEANSNHLPTVMATDVVNGCCMMIRADVVGKIGLIDERFYLVHEESDFCLRAKKAGFRCGVLTESHVWHKHSVTFSRDPSPLQRYYGSRNSWLLTKKHSDLPNIRGRWSTRKLLLRHAWWMINVELESGSPQSARAVVDGVFDAWFGRFGRRQDRRRPVAAVTSRAIFGLVKLRNFLQGHPERDVSVK